MKNKIVMWLAMVCMVGHAAAQDSAALAMVKQWVDARAFTFKAVSMTAGRGGTRQLNSTTYTVQVKGDTLVCDLPYVGQVYNASAITGETGMNFISYQFTYTAKPGKKNRLLLTIKTKDLNADRDLSFVLFDNGAATLSITSSDRQYISYQGRIAAK